MPNIVITNYCNLKCPYCFAQPMILNKKDNEITIQQLQKILKWLERSCATNMRIGLIGGEPTLHSNIFEILNIINIFCQKNDASSILFTNGIYLNKILDVLPNSIALLININSPLTMTSQQFSQLNDNLDILFNNNLSIINNTILGCNICQEINNYDFFWNIIEKYNSYLKNIRVSIVAPTKNIKYIDKFEYYISLKNKFLNFINYAEKFHIKLGLDCNQIPKCCFSAQEIEKINKNVIQRFPLCHPVVDITTDFKATSCFGTYELIDCEQFYTFDNLYNYLLYKKNVPLTLANTQGKCLNCLDHLNLQCQGGCLTFAQNK